MNGKRIKVLLDQLEDPNFRGRGTGALIELAHADQLPEQALDILVAALEDVESYDEDPAGCDLDGWLDEEDISDQSFYYWGPWYAAIAVAKLGLPAASEVLARAEAGRPGAAWLLPYVFSMVGAEALWALGRDRRDAARGLVREDREFPFPGWAAEEREIRGRVGRQEKALAALDFADAEQHQADLRRRWLGRLQHPYGPDQRRAAEALADDPNPRHTAACLADALLLGGGMAPAAQTAATRTLASLGPVLDDRRLAALMEAVAGNELYDGLPGALRTLGVHGESAIRLGALAVVEAWDQPEPPCEVSPAWEKVVRKAAREALAVFLEKH